MPRAGRVEAVANPKVAGQGEGQTLEPGKSHQTLACQGAPMLLHPAGLTTGSWSMVVEGGRLSRQGAGQGQSLGRRGAGGRHLPSPLLALGVL